MPIFSWFYRADRGPDDTESVADEQQPLDSEDENVDDSQPVFFLPENLGSPEGQHVFYDDLVYYTVFYPCVLAYHKYVPSTVRRIIEFLFLLKALMAFYVLIYMHIYFLKSSHGCLDHLNNTWPTNSVLRLEIIKPHQRAYAERMGTVDALLTLEESYDREIKARKKYITKMPYDMKYDFEESLFQDCEYKTNISKLAKQKKMWEEMKSNGSIPQEYQNTSEIENQEDDTDVKYILEYSTVIGFLGICPINREEMNIPVIYVPLEPYRNKCFGNFFIQYLQDTFLGYDDILLHSVKSLNANVEKKGYLRNCVTRQFYVSTNKNSLIQTYLYAMYNMILFTLFITVIFRYATHFLINIIITLENVDGGEYFPIMDGPISILHILIITLAACGLKIMMIHFFRNDTMVLTIILMVWLVDQFTVIFAHTVITRSHWLKFFYLYQFSFYFYHYRFCGRFSELSLFVAWCFIEHSMVYFFHHYEIPYVLFQNNIYETQFQNAANEYEASQEQNEHSQQGQDQGVQQQQGQDQGAQQQQGQDQGAQQQGQDQGAQQQQGQEQGTQQQQGQDQGAQQQQEQEQGAQQQGQDQGAQQQGQDQGVQQQQGQDQGAQQHQGQDQGAQQQQGQDQGTQQQQGQDQGAQQQQGQDQGAQQ